VWRVKAILIKDLLSFMNTEITTDLQRVVEALRNGDVVALPTETVYGLAASIDHEEALNKIFLLKGRPNDNPLIIHALDLQAVGQFAEVTPEFEKLYHYFMPGPLTVLLKKKAQVCDRVSCGLPTVACRIPAHPLFREVLRRLGKPLAAPSANLSGTPSSTCTEHVYDDFSPKLSLILEGGACSGGIESTLIKIEKGQGVILRPGLIEKKELEKVLGIPFIFASKNAQLEAPGMKYRHYAPKAKVSLIEDPLQFNQWLENPLGVFFLSKEPVTQAPIRWELLKEETLYASLRKADKEGYHSVCILMDHAFSEGMVNRLKKCAD